MNRNSKALAKRNNQIAKLEWYEFNQNNSGGKFTVNDSVCHRLFIQAVDADDACSIAEGLGVYFNGCDEGIDCECCGDRWYRPYSATEFPLEYSKTQTFTNIEEYTQFLADAYGWTVPDCRIYYKNGVVKDIFSSKKDLQKND